MIVSVQSCTPRCIQCTPTPTPLVQWGQARSRLRTHVQGNLSNTDPLEPLKCVLIRKTSSFQGVKNTYLCDVWTWSSVLRTELKCKLKGKHFDQSTTIFIRLITLLSSSSDSMYKEPNKPSSQCSPAQTE